MLLPQLLHHPGPPPPAPDPHRPQRSTPGEQAPEPQNRHQPAIPEFRDRGIRHDRAREAEYVSHKVVQRDAAGGSLGHELGQHGIDEGEDEHAADAEEEVRDHGERNGGVEVRGPAVSDEADGIQDGGEPCVFAHAVFGAEHEFAAVVVAAGFARLAVHDAVDPAAAEQRGEQVAGGVGDVEQADDEGRVGVGWLREGGLDGYVEDVQGAEGYGGVVDGEGDGGEAEPEDDA
jgi:hypothetical protein